MLTAHIRRFKSGKLTSLLYGTSPGEGVAELSPAYATNTTHSKTLARKNIVHELTHHKVKPECMEEYVQLINETYPKLTTEEDVAHVGSWKTVIGDDLDQAIHLWEYKGYQAYESAVVRLSKQKEFQDFNRKLAPLLRERRNQMCLEFAFWSRSPPVDRNALYELRSYTLNPGDLLEWEANWKRGLEIRRQYCSPVGAWFTQLGNLSVVHHLWTYPDLPTRKKHREQAWDVPGWADTVHNTGKTSCFNNNL